MSSIYEELTPQQLEIYGFARVRDIAFDAVHDLWRRRRAEGMTQKDLADRIGRDPAWVSRSLRGPGNWTLRTIGAFVIALRGDIDIQLSGLEDPLGDGRNSDAYSGYNDTAPLVKEITSIATAYQTRRRLNLVESYSVGSASRA